MLFTVYTNYKMHKFPKSHPLIERFSIVIFLTFFIVTAVTCIRQRSNPTFQDHFPDNVQRTWIGPDYWANRLQDWQLNNGRAECIQTARNRNLNLLTVRTGDRPGDFTMSVRLGVPALDSLSNKENLLGFRIGINGQFDDYRDDAIYGKGLDAGITTSGDLFIGAPPVKHNGNAVALLPFVKKGLTLRLKAEYQDNKYNLTLEALDDNGKALATLKEEDVPAKLLAGGIALVSHFPEGQRKTDAIVSWFDDLSVSGKKVDLFPERAFGPVLFEQYTLSKGILKMTAQLPPTGPDDGKTVGLQIKEKNKWKTIQEQKIDPDARTATFKIENRNYTEDIPFRLVYELNTGNGQMKTYYLEGTVRKEPWDKEEIVVAGFTGNNDLGFPNNDLVKAVTFHNPDILFFSGDQIYEGVGGFGAQRKPLDKAMLDYLRKWYLFGWAYGNLLRDRPSITIPDDHDVYHGNIWGCEGKSTPPGLTGFAAQDAGGYKMPAEWVKMVERTQTSHLPDPYDPRPVKQGIGVYYTDLNYAGVSFAILEDRKFKSAPKPLLPEAKISNGWYQNRSWDPVTQSDVPGAKLLGERQLQFLEHWSGDWSGHAWMKMVLSQTIFANVATLPAEAYHDDVVPSLRIMHKGEYPPDDRPVADMDSDGWPQTGRNKAIRAMRKAFALHLAGDQHLGSVIQYGVEDWRDSDYAFCVPSISNIWPRRWFPAKGGMNRETGAPKYTGDFYDGFGNKVTVLAVSNPVYTGKEPSELYDRATGYGIVRLSRKTRKITMECWPGYVDPATEPGGQYPGWPITISQTDNYNRKATGWLPRLEIQNMKEPVIRVFSEKDNALVYAIRLNGNTFDPKVFRQGSYRMEVGDPDTGKWKKFTGLEPDKKTGTKTLKVVFE